MYLIWSQVLEDIFLYREKERYFWFLPPVANIGVLCAIPGGNVLTWFWDNKKRNDTNSHKIEQSISVELCWRALPWWPWLTCDCWRLHSGTLEKGTIITGTEQKGKREKQQGWITSHQPRNSRFLTSAFLWDRFSSSPELVVWAGRRCLAWNTHQHPTHAASKHVRGPDFHIGKRTSHSLLRHTLTTCPTCPGWAADGSPPCHRSHNGLMWDLL